jgi:hypothetical protein
MTARTYNFTKHNGVLCKAKKRFTKVSGVRKRILSGWTKQNGIVEKVYEGPQQSFFVVATFDGVDGSNTSDARGVYSIDENNIIFTVYSGALYLLDDYIINSSGTRLTGGGAVVKYASPDDNTGTRMASFNYSANSLMFGGTAVYYSEMPIATPLQPAGPSRPSRTYGMKAPIKSDVVGEFYGQNGGKIYNTAADGTQTFIRFLAYSAYYSNISPGIILADGHGYYLWNYSTSSSASAARDFVLVKVLNGTTTLINVDSIADTNSPDWCLSGIYTIDGTELFFSFQTGTFGTDNYAHFCKYNVSDGTVTKVQVARGKQIIGTYGGYIFALASNSDASDFCAIERYDTDLQYVDSHSIPAQQNLKKLDDTLRQSYDAQSFGIDMIYGTITSNSEFVGFNCYNSIIVVDLTQF